MVFAGNKARIRNYIYWLCDIVDCNRGTWFSKFEILLDIEYEPMYGNDENRAIDGLALRRRYEQEKGFDILDDSPCSQLEMMVALAERAVELMSDDDENNVPGFYFDMMIHNLELNRVQTKRGIQGKIDDNYPFDTKNRPDGWEEMELWKQMNWVLTQLWYENGDDEWE